MNKEGSEYNRPNTCRGIIVPVEEGVEVREVSAGAEGLVRWESVVGASLSVGRRRQEHQEDEHT